MTVPDRRLPTISSCERLQQLQRIPNELWLKILAQISRGDLANVSLASSLFLPVSRTLKFEVFTFHPYNIDYHTKTPQRLTRSVDEVDTAIRRLEFWVSEPIAPLVREINVSPLHIGNENQPCIPADTNRDPDILMNALFQQLHHFTHLQRLDCFLLDFAESALQSLSQLPFLADLRVERCSISASLTPSASFRLAHLQCQDAFATYEQLEACGVQRWLSFLDPSRLEHLVVFPARVASVFFRDIGAIGIMSSLHTINIGLPVAPLNQIVSILSKTPALKTLYITNLGVPELNVLTQAQSIPFSSSSPVPFLSMYRGPYELLNLIHPGRALCYLALHLCNGAFLLESLRPFQNAMQGVEYLELSLRDISETTFSALSLMFVGVKSLHLQVSDNDGSDLRAIFFDRHLPQPPPDNAAVSPGVIKSKIFAEFPALRYLWLQCGVRFEMFWMKPDDGPEIVEECDAPFDYNRRSLLQRIFEDSSNLDFA